MKSKLPLNFYRGYKALIIDLILDELIETDNIVMNTKFQTIAYLGYGIITTVNCKGKGKVIPVLK
jgi:hypothetical protein